jgi:hypothetical protein
VQEHTCESCGAKIPAGDLFYRFHTEFISGFDNYVPEPEEDAERLIMEACKAMLGRSEKELMNEVYEEISFLLCPGCRKKVRSYLLSMKAAKPKAGKILHFPPTGKN